MIPFGTKSVTLSMLIDPLTSTMSCRSTQVKIASIDLWPQEMFTFSEMLALVESESSFGAYICHRRPGGSLAISDLVRCHDGHFKALSRCRLVGRSVRPGENFLSFSRLQLSQRHPPMRIRKCLDQNCSQISEEVQVFFIFRNYFLTILFSGYHGDQTISRTSCRFESL